MDYRGVIFFLQIGQFFIKKTPNDFWSTFTENKTVWIDLRQDLQKISVNCHFYGGLTKWRSGLLTKKVPKMVSQKSYEQVAKPT